MNSRDSKLINSNSEGYLVLWQAPQQNPHSMQTLRYDLFLFSPAISQTKGHLCMIFQPHMRNMTPKLTEHYYQVVAPSTFKNTPVHHVAIPLLRFVNVRAPSSSPFQPLQRLPTQNSLHRLRFTGFPTQKSPAQDSLPHPTTLHK